MKKTLFLLLAVVAWVCVSAAGNYIDKTLVLLPGDSSLKFNWILPPQGKGGEGLSFRMGNKGGAWFGSNGKNVMSLKDGFSIGLKDPFDDFMVNSSGLPVFVSKDYLCIMTPVSGKKLGSTELSFQPLAKLPAGNCRLYPAGKGMLYISGTGAGTGNSEVYTAGGENGTLKVEGKGKAFLYTKIFSTEKRISALAGDGKDTFVAIGKLVIKTGAGKAEGFFVHPKSDITGLAYDPAAGLFYCTEKGVGYASKDGSLEFLRVSKPAIAVSGGKLYIYLQDDNGLLEISNIKEFSGFVSKQGVKK